MADQLSLYNDALSLCGERFLASLTEEREPRRLLDHAWANDPIKACLAMGQWTFAMRAMQIDYDSSIQPAWGYARSFTKPTDWVITSALCSDEYFAVPLTRYIDEAGFWYSDLDTMYVRYVSDASTYGRDYNKWPDSFREVVAEFLCGKVVRKLTGSEEEQDRSTKRLERKLLRARNETAMAQPTAFPAQGGWTRARQGSRSGSYDGPHSGNLIG